MALNKQGPSENVEFYPKAQFGITKIYLQKVKKNCRNFISGASLLKISLLVS